MFSSDPRDSSPRFTVKRPTFSFLGEPSPPVPELPRESSSGGLEGLEGLSDRFSPNTTQSIIQFLDHNPALYRDNLACCNRLEDEPHTLDCPVFLVFRMLFEVGYLVEMIAGRHWDRVLHSLAYLAVLLDHLREASVE